MGGDWPSKIGIKGVPDNAFPQIIATGFTNLGSDAQERRQFPIEQYQFVENLSWVRGRHAMKFGAEVRPSRNYESNLPTASGAFTFGTTASGMPGVAASGNGMATLLLGFPTGFATRQTPILDRKNWYLAGVRAGRLERSQGPDAEFRRALGNGHAHRGCRTTA